MQRTDFDKPRALVHSNLQIWKFNERWCVCLTKKSSFDDEIEFRLFKLVSQEWMFEASRGSHQLGRRTRDIVFDLRWNNVLFWEPAERALMLMIGSNVERCPVPYPIMAILAIHDSTCPAHWATLDSNGSFSLWDQPLRKIAVTAGPPNIGRPVLYWSPHATGIVCFVGCKTSGSLWYTKFDANQSSFGEWQRTPKECATFPDGNVMRMFLWDDAVSMRWCSETCAFKEESSEYELDDAEQYNSAFAYSGRGIRSLDSEQLAFAYHEFDYFLCSDGTDDSTAWRVGNQISRFRVLPDSSPSLNIRSTTAFARSCFESLPPNDRVAFAASIRKLAQQTFSSRQHVAGSEPKQ